MPEYNVALYCDISTQNARPYITEPFRRAAFDTVHRHSHPGSNCTVKLATKRFIWPSIKTDCREWARTCLDCQSSKVTRHVITSPGSFAPPSARFEHVHIDIIVMPVSENCRYCLTCVDRFSRWPEAIPMENQEAETVARAFYSNWITRFGTPIRVTTDQGRQFESHLFRHLNILTGVDHFRTTAYHPASNGMVERLHRQLKSAIKCHNNNSWTRVLPTVLMGIRAAWKEDIQATPAEMIYGQSIRLPGEFLHSHTNNADTQSQPEFVKELRQHFHSLRPVAGTHHGQKHTFIYKELATTSHVFIRNDSAKRPLQKPYEGPYKVVSRNDKTFVVSIRGRDVTVSIDRLKPAYILVEQQHEDHRPVDNYINIQLPTPQTPPTPITHPTHSNTHQSSRADPSSNSNQHDTVHRTRSGRRVRFPDYYQAGFS